MRGRNYRRTDLTSILLNVDVSDLKYVSTLLDLFVLECHECGSVKAYPVIRSLFQ